MSGGGRFAGSTGDRARLPTRATGPCLSCLLVLIGLITAVIASFAYLKVDFSGLFSAESATAMRKFAGEFFPPDHRPAFLAQTAWATLQTLAVSLLGTLLAGVLGAALALPAAGRFGGAARGAARLLLNLLRSVPELVWAVLMVLAAGLGPFAGVLALALHTAGVFGRLFGETLENAPRQPEQALTEAGGGAVAAFAYGTLPLVLPQWVAYGLYRWEMNIRMAAVLGFVGAGGLGQMLYFHLSLFQQAQSATVLSAMCLLVIGVDAISATLRHRLAPAGA